MKSVSRLAALCACAAGALLAAAPSAHAACARASATFADSRDDAGGVAPELTDVTVALDAGCGLSMSPGISALQPEDALVTYIDRDVSATDDADVVLMTVTQGAQPVTFIADGQLLDIGDSTPVGTTSAAGAVSVPIDRLGIAPGATVGVRVVALRFGEIEQAGTDYAPEPEAEQGIVLPVRADGAPAPGTGAPGAATPQPPILTPTTRIRRCTVPRVKGRSRAAARARLARRGCSPARTVIRRHSATVAKGRVIGTSPGSGRRTAKRVTLIVSKGPR